MDNEIKNQTDYEKLKEWFETVNKMIKEKKRIIDTDEYGDSTYDLGDELIASIDSFIPPDYHGIKAGKGIEIGLQNGSQGMDETWLTTVENLDNPDEPLFRLEMYFGDIIYKPDGTREVNISSETAAKLMQCGKLIDNNDTLKEILNKIVDAEPDDKFNMYRGLAEEGLELYRKMSALVEQRQQVTQENGEQARENDEYKEADFDAEYEYEDEYEEADFDYEYEDEYEEADFDAEYQDEGETQENVQETDEYQEADFDAEQSAESDEQDYGSMSIEQLRQAVSKNERTISSNEDEIKQALIVRLLEQQKIIAQQEAEMAMIRSQKEK